MRRQPGDTVLIIEDCRDGGVATGQTGIYEGDFPRTAQVKNGDQWQQFDYHQWTSGEVQTEDGTPGNQLIPLWEAGTPEPEGCYWFPIDNPRIRLPDGSVIWGDECWWRNAGDAQSLEEEQTELQRHKAFLQGMFQAVAEEYLESGGEGE